VLYKIIAASFSERSLEAHNATVTSYEIRSETPRRYFAVADLAGNDDVNIRFPRNRIKVPMESSNGKFQWKVPMKSSNGMCLHGET
jgi:hypothetical protein